MSPARDRLRSPQNALIFRARDEDDIRARLSVDPWGEDMLTLARIAPWSLRLGERRFALDGP
jgi:hypothetical protein